MTRSIPESDWKLFRQLHSVALGRYCQKVLDDIAQITADTETAPHQRYLQIYKVIQQRDRTLGGAFDDLRRSTALLRLTAIHALGIITEDELGRFTQGTRDLILNLSR